MVDRISAQGFEDLVEKLVDETMKCAHEVVYDLGVQKGACGIPDFKLVNCFVCRTTLSMSGEYEVLENMFLTRVRKSDVRDGTDVYTRSNLYVLKKQKNLNT